MSYTKIDIRYTTDGMNTVKFVNTRQGEKHKTIGLSKKVQKYGDEHGYDSIEIDYCGDHIIFKSFSGDVLQEQDINGTNNNEYIRKIVSYDWLY